MPDRVLDLFAGFGGWSEPWRQAGAEICTVDLDPRFGADIQEDFLKMRLSDLPWIPTIVLASPPCEAFSTLAGDLHWQRGKPQTRRAVIGQRMVLKTDRWIRELKPRHGLIENPRALLRKIWRAPTYTVSYCHYGDDRLKPTDLWIYGERRSWTPRVMCHPRPYRDGKPLHDPECCCFDHREDGVLSRPTSRERAMIPEDLAREIWECWR